LCSMNCKNIFNYEALRCDLRTVSECPDEKCNLCQVRYVHLKDLRHHGHLSMKKVEVVSNKCIPKGHFIACVTGVVVEGEMEQQDDDASAVVNAKEYRVWTDIHRADVCAQAKGLFLRLGASQVPVCDLFKYNKYHNAVLDEAGYVWAATNIRRGTTINVLMDLALLVVEFHRFKKALRDFPATDFLEYFGDPERGDSYSILEYILDTPKKFTRALIKRYIPQLLKLREFQRGWELRHPKY